MAKRAGSSSWNWGTVNSSSEDSGAGNVSGSLAGAGSGLLAHPENKYIKARIAIANKLFIQIFRLFISPLSRMWVASALALSPDIEKQAIFGKTLYLTMGQTHGHQMLR
jgi:hypothetical protein